MKQFNCFGCFVIIIISIICLCYFIIFLCYFINLNINKEKSDKIKAPSTDINSLPSNFCVKQFKVYDETHEYLYGIGTHGSKCITHLPNCRYCKGKK